MDTGFGERAGFSKEDAEAALPAVMWESPEAVAKTGVDGLDKGQLVAIPGIVNRAASVLVQFVPNKLLLPILAKQHPGLR